MAITIGVEVRRYATVTVDAEDIDEAMELASDMALRDDISVDWNEPEVSYREFISHVYDAEDDFFDKAYEEQRDAMYA